MKAIIDNDILFKGSCFGLLEELVSTNLSPNALVGVLGAARFVVLRKIRQTALSGSSSAAIQRFLMFLDRAETLEPTLDEQNMAADLELAAQGSSVSLDAGESQLCAILVSRMLPLLITGDKRAIEAIEVLLDSDPRLVYVTGKVKCLEQLFWGLLERGNVEMIRGAVCAESGIDATLTICFSCASVHASMVNLWEGLNSYIRALRMNARRVLAP